MPELEPMDVDYVHLLFEAGPAKSGFNGPVQLDWVDIDAWQRLTQAHLSPAEALLLRQLSAIYASAASNASEPDAESPWLEQDVEHKTEQVQAAEQGLAAIFRSMTTKPPKPPQSPPRKS